MDWKDRLRAQLAYFKPEAGHNRPSQHPPGINDKLPPELISEVIGWTAFSQQNATDYKTLCNLALVCRSWRPAAQAMLFRTTVIKSMDQMTLFIRAVASPRLGDYVQTLRVPPLPSSRQEAFARCFAVLPNIRELDLGTQLGFNASRIGILRDAMCCLDTFRFSDAYIATQLLVLPPWRQIKVLEYKPDVRELPDVYNEGSLPTPSFSLQEVRWTGHYDRQLLWCISNSQQTLTILRLSDAVKWKTVQTIVGMVGPSLRSLDLEGTYYPDLQASLRLCTQLEELKLGVSPSDAILDALPQSLARLHFCGRHISPGPIINFVRSNRCFKLRNVTFRSGSMMGRWEELREICEAKGIIFRLLRPATPRYTARSYRFPTYRDHR